MCENDIGRILNAAKYAASKHRNQRRKDPEASPYINHPLEVAELLWNTGKVHDEEVIIAALLHDVIEDAGVKFEEIAAKFGGRVASLVMEVTDDKTLEKAERKRLQEVHAPSLTSAAKLIKLSDKICNVKDVIINPPRDWGWNRRMEYIEWARRVVERLGPVNRDMQSIWENVYQEAQTGLASIPEEARK